MSESVDPDGSWSKEQLWDWIGEVQRDRQEVLKQRDEARVIACKLLYIAEHRGPKVFGPRPPWLEPNAAIEVKHNCDKIIADLMNQRDQARAYAAKANDLWQGAMDALATVENEGDAARAEVAYLRRQIKLEENFRDPEFGGCVADPAKPEHLRRDERD